MFVTIDALIQDHRSRTEGFEIGKLLTAQHFKTKNKFNLDYLTYLFIPLIYLRRENSNHWSLSWRLSCDFTLTSVDCD